MKITATENFIATWVVLSSPWSLLLDFSSPYVLYALRDMPRTRAQFEPTTRVAVLPLAMSRVG
jgi:hypothetical protein